MPQQRGGAEARPVGDAVDVEVGLLQQPPGVEHALIGDPLHGRAAGLVDEPAGEGARRHAARARRGWRPCAACRGWPESNPDAAQSLPNTAPGSAGRCTGAGHRRAAAAPPSGGRSMLVISLPSSRRTRCRQASMPAAVPALVIRLPSSTNSTLRSTSAVGIHAGQLVGVHPVRGARPAVEQPGGTRHERARAHRQDDRSRRRRRPAGPRAPPAGSRGPADRRDGDQVGADAGRRGRDRG